MNVLMNKEAIEVQNLMPGDRFVTGASDTVYTCESYPRVANGRCVVTYKVAGMRCELNTVALATVHLVD